MKIYLIHTQFNAANAYGNEITNDVFKENTNGLNRSGFGIDKSLVMLYWGSEGLCYSFDDNIARPENHPKDGIILLVSDKKYAEVNQEGKKVNSEAIDNRLNTFLNEDDTVLLAYHQNNNYNKFPEAYKKLAQQAIAKSHLANDTATNLEKNPFYQLVAIVNSEDEDAFNEGFSKLQSCFSTAEELENETVLNKKLSLLYKILGEPLLTENNFKGEEKELAQPYFDCDISDSKEDTKTARLRYLRDVLLKNVI